MSYLKRSVGPKLWRILTEALCEEVNKTNFKSSLERKWRKHTSRWVNQKVTEESLIQNPSCTSSGLKRFPIKNQADWGEAIDVSAFYGRIDELAKLEQWILNDRCRLITILGMGGIGKTANAAKLAIQIQSQFEYVIWRSLRNAPSIDEILTQLLQFLGQRQNDLPKTVDEKILRLMETLRSHRCLIILDNGESILQSGDSKGNYREGYEEYGHLLRCIAEIPHQSCLLLTSSEKPKGLANKEGEHLPVRSIRLTGLQLAEGRKIFQLKGTFSGSKSEWESVIKHYAGNPLALKIVATGILEVFQGNISKFLKYRQLETLIFDDIQSILQRQFNRLTNEEQTLMYWLAINRESVVVEKLQEYFVNQKSQSELLEILVSLLERSPIEINDNCFTQQPFIIQYVTERFLKLYHQEITLEQAKILSSHKLLETTTKDPSRESQIRQILKQITDGIHIKATYQQNLAKNLNRNINKSQTMNKHLTNKQKHVLA